MDVAVDVIEGFRRHRTGRNAALISHFGFISVFPLLLAMTTMLGFVLENHEQLRKEIVKSAFSKVPIIGPTIADNPSGLKGSAVALVLGLLAALWAGMKAFVAVQGALDDIAEVDIDERAPLALSRGRAMIGIGIAAVTQFGGAAVSALVGVPWLAAVSRVLLLAASVAISTLALGCIYRWLCNRPLPWARLLPGALVGGVIFAGLQLLTATIVSRALAKASPIYGTFAGVIALLTWLSLHALVLLLGAELNGVLDSPRTRTQALGSAAALESA